MKFFNKKEDVLDIQLTQYGKHLLSKGELEPTYYAFFDDDVLYDSKYGGGESEAQNETQDRIEKETPSLRTQYVFSGRETAVKENNKRISAWLTYQNFHAVKTYNSSNYYALLVHLLAEKIKHG